VILWLIVGRVVFFSKSSLAVLRMLATLKPGGLIGSRSPRSLTRMASPPVWSWSKEFDRQFPFHFNGIVDVKKVLHLAAVAKTLSEEASTTGSDAMRGL
jgi:hypothetical protein